MPPLLDVNLLLASAWDSHPDHAAARAWLTSCEEFYTCPITELGFVRVSMSPAFSAAREDAIEFLEALNNLSASSRVEDNCWPNEIPPVTSYKDTTDAYLVLLASKNDLRLATLDQRLLKKNWAQKTAFDPLNI